MKLDNSTSVELILIHSTVVEKVLRVGNAAIKLRFAVTRSLGSDVNYNWTEYDNVPPESSKPKNDNPLAQIKVFSKLTNEEIMYKKAEELGNKAARLRKRLDAKRKRTLWLDASSHGAAEVPTVAINHGSISDDHLSLTKHNLTEELGY